MSSRPPDYESPSEQGPEAPERVPEHAQYIGTDGAGVDHYWSIYQRTDYLVDDGEVQSWPLGETPCPTLGTWCVHVANKRGPWDELMVDVDPSALERWIAERNLERDSR